MYGIISTDNKLKKIEKPNNNDIQKIWKKDSYNNLLKEIRKILKF